MIFTTVSTKKWLFGRFGFVEEIIKNREEKKDNTYAEIELFYSNSNCSQQRYNK